MVEGLGFRELEGVGESEHRCTSNMAAYRTMCQTGQQGRLG